MRTRYPVALLSLLSLLSLAGMAMADDWSQFRGPNASGVSANASLPVEFGPDKNVIWKTPLPPGHSSPVLTQDRIFVTAFNGEKLLVIALDRASGKKLWEREIPRPRRQELHKSNSPASPSVVTDGRNIFAFFTDYGLLSWTTEGKERWQLPLGPFNNPFGMGSSPVLAGNLVLLNCDSESASFFLAVDKNTGKVKWHVDRAAFTRGFSTPVLYKPARGPLQVLVAGSLRLVAYDVATGKEIWWVRGLTWQIKPTPVLGPEMLYVLGWAGGADPGQQEDVGTLSEALPKYDADRDGKISRDEAPTPAIKKDWIEYDLDRDGFLGPRDWDAYRAKRSVVNGVLAFHLDSQRELRGDMTASLKWRYEKSLPNTPSPLLYQDVVYLMKEGGILTSLDAGAGTLLKQGRLRNALGAYYASPVAASGRIYTISEEGRATVIKAGAEWEILAVNDLGDACHATPAIMDNRLYIRTHGMLYCFGNS